MGKGETLLACLCLITVGLLFFGSVPVFGNADSSGAGKSALKEAREDLEQKLAGMPGFAGIAHSEEEGQIIVFLENGQAKGNVPDSHRGFPVRKEVTGPFKALGTQVMQAPASSRINQASYDRKGVVRPLVGGISLSALAGKLYIYAGTLGMVTYDNKILSNAHVIAMNPDNNAFLALGTTVIIQPGSLDGGRTSANQVGALKKYIQIIFSKPRAPVNNYADAAIASIDSTVTGKSGSQLDADNINFYHVSGTTLSTPGDSVRKSGRTTGVTTNTVMFTNASTWIDYGRGMKAYFVDQILVIQPFIDAGDSGSCVDKGGNFVGLAFAGSSSYAIVCKASYIISGLNISVGP